ncbi:optineurin [Salvelinus sp. IW2-2015]|uniref:optineurin n=1 Tax=Salvelinus sp. IW2-2015 TaxID=2691554 RepID=UPI0038D43DCD
MVQPQNDTWDMAGDEGGGALRVPPELAANEVVTRLLGDNQQLREALQRSNQALRERCEEMEEWQRRSREEREFLSCRFQEARALVKRLTRENHSLTSLASPSSPSNPEASQGLLVNGPSVSQDSCPNSTNCSSNGGPGRGGEQEKSSETNGTMATSLVTERGMEKKGAEENEQMMLHSLCVCVCRYRELQEKLDSLQKTSAQRDRTEVLLKQKDKDCAQLAKDGEALKAQVTSLLGELRERQSCLDQSQQDRNILDDKYDMFVC